MTTDMLRCALRGVAAYRPVVDEPVMRLALGVLDKLSAGDGSGAVEDYARLFYALRSAGSRSLGEWLDGRLRDRESPYAALVERGGEDPALEAAARRDIETFTLLAELDWDQVLAEVGGKAPREYGPVLANLPRWRGSSPFSFAEPTARGSLPGTGLSCGKMGRSARWSNPTVPARTRCWAMSSSGTGSSPIPGPCWRATW